MSDAGYVRIFDTTLRDGEQSPGATMTSKEKLEVAKTLSRLGVDVIEAGFPAASPDDLRAVKSIAETVGVGAPDSLAPGSGAGATAQAESRRRRPPATVAAAVTPTGRRTTRFSTRPLCGGQRMAVHATPGG